MEYLFLNIYLGSFVFLAGAVVFYFLLNRIIRNVLTVVVVDLIHLLFSTVLSLAIWRFWPFGFDVTYGLLSFPALLAEFVVIISSYWAVKFFYIRKSTSGRELIKNWVTPF